MDLALYAVKAVLVEGRSVREVGVATGRSKSWVHRHVVLFCAGGADALTPAKRGPTTAPNQTPPAVEDAIVGLRKHLVELGLDAGASTIATTSTSKGSRPQHARRSIGSCAGEVSSPPNPSNVPDRAGNAPKPHCPTSAGSPT
jgi:hypothetical protein